jgi:hypothetical protein
MKTCLSLTLCTLTAAGALAADSKSKDEITAAAKKLSEQPNYSWTTTVVVPESAQFKPGPTEGKTEKDGFTYVTLAFGDSLTEVVMKGDKTTITDQDGNWKLASELENAEGRDRFLGRMARNLRTPAAQVPDLISGAKELKKDGEAYTAELTEEGAKKQFRFGQPQNPKGSVKFWVKDGTITKYEVKVEAKMDFNGNEIDASRTSTTEIKKIGTTNVNAPGDAKKKLS